MAVYTIIRIYEVPAETHQQATDRMLEALVLHVEKGEKPARWNTVKLAPPAGWLTLIVRQLTGK